VRGADIVARTGGEEFIVVLPGQDLTSAHLFAERVRRSLREGDALAQRRALGIDRTLTLTVSGGVAAARAPKEGQALIDAADRAMYRAKRSGRDRVVDAIEDPGLVAIAA
jgi:two-component system chemotaxis family response regulator WspR